MNNIRYHTSTRFANNSQIANFLKMNFSSAHFLTALVLIVSCTSSVFARSAVVAKPFENDSVIEMNSDVVIPKAVVDKADDVPESPEDGWVASNLRVTCDILSASAFGVTLNHAPCAVHCLAKGYKGGECKSAVCHCRR